MGKAQEEGRKRESCTALANYLHNRALELSRQVAPCGSGLQTAVDGRGFIVDQRLLGAYRMGGASSDRCGCGWVACYNALRLLGQKPRPARVIRTLERMGALALRGRLGVRAAALPLFFLCHGCRVSLSFTRAGAARQAAAAPANILYYIRGRLWPSAHYVAFERAGAAGADGEPLYRFYNSLSAPLLPRRPAAGQRRCRFCAGGDAGDLRSLNELLRPERAVFMLVLSIRPAEGRDKKTRRGDGYVRTGRQLGLPWAEGLPGAGRSGPRGGAARL